MYDFGFIGFGSMAKMLIHSLIKYSKVSPGIICATRKDKTKLHEISDTFPGVKTYDTCREIAVNAHIVFLCVKPAEIKGVLLEIKPFIKSGTHIVSLAGTVSFDNLDSIIRGKISKLIPTITSESGAGISLVCHNGKVTGDDAELLEKSISPFGKVKAVSDSDLGFAAELTSCAPGFIASIFGHFANAASLHTSSFSLQEISEMVTETLFATAKLLTETDMSFEDVVSRVATKGGITREGVTVFDETLPPVFDEMFKKTLEKRRLVAAKINDDFKNT
jgi:pyrroline-5-carboxylate reductase